MKLTISLLYLAFTTTSLSQHLEISAQEATTNLDPSQFSFSSSSSPFDDCDPKMTNCESQSKSLNPNPSTNNENWVPSYDCEGSIMCNTISLNWCDEAVNEKLQRRDDITYGPGLTKVGACGGWGTFGCAIFIQGDDSCNRTGNQLWWDYQDIRSVGHCSKCGTKHWYPGCMTTVNYVTWCNSDKMDYQ